MISSSIEGKLIVRCYLRHASTLKFGLSPDIRIGRSVQNGSDQENNRDSSQIQVDSFNFHESLDLTKFEANRELSLRSFDGELTLFNYRLSRYSPYIHIPFGIHPHLEKLSSRRFCLTIKVICDLSALMKASTFVMSIPLPKRTTHASMINVMPPPKIHKSRNGRVKTSLDKLEYDDKTKVAMWERRRFYGQSEGCIKINITIDRETKTLRDVGPISVRFEIPNYTPTGIEIRYLRIQPAGLHSALVSSPTSPLGAAQGEPSRWVRYVCYAGDFSCRVAAA
mmetsp:Transcript_10821/g.26465  ORF Transcript_10821/g.26465 Transcript_10821/m.26465 type:complete len:281 (+) Transcript_10821:729-1571(+)